jgi:hypothetical protein
VSLLIAQRVLVLGGVALLCGLVSLGAVARAEDDEGSLPESVEAPGEGWYETLAVPRRTAGSGGRTACGYRLTARTDGVGHPVLPCGTRIYVAYGSVEALTQVLARGSATSRSQFVVTRSLARKLGLASTDLIRWRYARDE